MEHLAARQRHRQFHQDRAARAGADRAAFRQFPRLAPSARPLGHGCGDDERGGEGRGDGGRRHLGRTASATGEPPLMDGGSALRLAPELEATTPAPPPPPPAERHVTRRDWITFLAMVFGMFMAILDIQIVSSSLSEIQAGLAASADEISWVQTAYLIAEVVMIPLSGYL